MEQDLRDIIFRDIEHKKFIATITSEEEGLLVGTDFLERRGKEIGVKFLSLLAEGSHISQGTVIAKFIGSPKQIAVCEDNLVGLISKHSGVGRAAEKAKKSSDNKKIRIVCGAWKKVPSEMKAYLRRAVEVGGLKTSITDKSFIYLDKNYVRMLQGIKESLDAVSGIEGRLKVIQLIGETAAIEEEVLDAVAGKADILMIDTGKIEDVRKVIDVLQRENKRSLVKIAFAGGIGLDDIPALLGEDIDILDIGRAIIDAPLLDMRLNVLGVVHGG